MHKYTFLDKTGCNAYIHIYVIIKSYRILFTNLKTALLSMYLTSTFLLKEKL